MMIIRLAAGVVAACAAISVAGNSFADSITTYTLADGYFTDFGTFYGTITVDNTTMVTTFDVTTTSGNELPGDVYTSTSPDITVTPSYHQFVFNDSANDTELALNFSGYEDNLTLDFGFEEHLPSGSPSRDIYIGDLDVTTMNEPVNTVPEPAAWAMMLVGVAFAGAALRRRGRIAVPA
jgi:hypothetical protein